MKAAKDIIAVIGLGYVGLPLAHLFAKKYSVIGFDIDNIRIDDLKRGFDKTRGLKPHELNEVSVNVGNKNVGLKLTSCIDDIRLCNIFIITVPTPVDSFNVPDLKYILKASRMIAMYLKKGDIVIYESTVYPGCTEEECVPILEKASKLKFNEDFFVGYSPERVSPGSQSFALNNITKITSGSNLEIASKIDLLYSSIIDAGTYKASSIKVAEAAKVIENTQRDLNISFMNEIALIFDRMEIDTTDVLNAASTKFNFLKFYPGLVGGHCISVDPYYLTHKAIQLGYYPEVILSGRRVNNNMADFIVKKVIKLMISKDILIKGANVLVLGITFKENCNDIRNTKVIDIVREITEYGVNVHVYDPIADPEDVFREYNIELLKDVPSAAGNYDGIILAVAHNEFKLVDYKGLRKPKSVIFDAKSFLPRDIIDARL